VCRLDSLILTPLALDQLQRVEAKVCFDGVAVLGDFVAFHRLKKSVLLNLRFVARDDLDTSLIADG
jgi:hypothetical protein